MIVEAADNISDINEILVGLDTTSSEFKFINKNKHNINFNTPESTRDASKFIMGDDLIVFYKDIIEAYITIIIKENSSQEDWYSWSKSTNEVWGKVQTAKDIDNISHMEDKGYPNCILLNNNNIYFIYESIDTVKLLK